MLFGVALLMETYVGCYFINGLLTPSRALERVPIL